MIVKILVSFLAMGIVAAYPQPDRSPRMIFGSPAPIENFPYQASVRLLPMGPCGGAIISEYHILTSASCFCKKPGIMTVRYGTESSIEGGRLSNVSRIICHDKFNENGKGEYDIAIVVLDEQNKLAIDGNTTRIIPLAQENPRTNEWGYLSSFGFIDPEQTKASKTFYQAAVQVVNQTDCKSDFDQRFVNDDKFCAGGKGGPDTCKYDGGAILAVNGQLAGVASSSGCGDLKHYAKYTSVAFHKDWIEKNMKMEAPEEPSKVPQLSYTSGAVEEAVAPDVPSKTRPMFDTIKKIEDFLQSTNGTTIILINPVINIANVTYKV